MGLAQPITTMGAGMEADRQYYIGVGRNAALKAFRHIRQRGESPVAYFDGAHRPDTPRRTPTKPRQYVMHAVETRPSGSSKPNLVDKQSLDGAVHRAIAELEPMQFQWIQYRYRPDGLARTQHGAAFQREYFRRYEAEHLQGCKTGTRRMVRYLISVAMDNEGNPGRRAAQPDGYDASPRNWNKTYRPHWHRICAELSKLDADALFQLGQKIDKSEPIA